jgi:hypothetical protein
MRVYTPAAFVLYQLFEAFVFAALPPLLYHQMFGVLFWVRLREHF